MLTSLPHRTESPGTEQSPHFDPAGHRDDESCATSSAARRVAQFLPTSGVIVRSAENWNSTRTGAAAREWNDVVDDVAVRVDVVGDLRLAVRPVLRLPDDHRHVRIDRAVRSGVG
jgi:hypothetical protein